MCYTSLQRLPNFYLHVWFYRGRCYCCRWQWCLFLSSYFLTSECIEHIESIVWVLRWSSFSCFFCCCHHHHHFQQKPPWLHQISHANLDTIQYVYISKSWHDRIITFFCLAHMEEIIWCMMNYFCFALIVFGIHSEVHTTFLIFCIIYFVVYQFK